jgi:hypothetical protein
MTPAGLITTILIITLGIVDLCFVVFGGTSSSVSQFLINAGYASPTFMLGLGFVLGHLFGPMFLDTSRLKAAWDAYRYREGDRAPEREELQAAIDEIVNANHGPTRYFRRKK